MIKKLTDKQQKWLLRILIAFGSYLIVIIIHQFPFFKEGQHGLLSLTLYLIPYLIAGYDVLLEAFENIFHGALFDENFLMSIATFGAFGVREYKEATAVMLFYQIGELFQNYAVEKSRKSITEMMEIVPETAHLVIGKQILDVAPDNVDKNSIIIINLYSEGGNRL